MIDDERQHYRIVVTAGIVGFMMFFVGGLSLATDIGYWPAVAVLGDTIIGVIPPLGSFGLILGGYGVMYFGGRIRKRSDKDE